jgi:hypothetical protein
MGTVLFQVQQLDLGPQLLDQLIGDPRTDLGPNRPGGGGIPRFHRRLQLAE